MASTATSNPASQRHYDSEMRIRYMETIELPLTVGVNRYNFNDVPNLREALVTGLETHDNSVVPQSSTNASVIVIDTLKRTHVTLVHEGSENISRIPLYTLLSTHNNGIVKMFANLKIDWTKSYVEIGNGAVIVSGNVILLNVYYKKGLTKAEVQQKLKLYTAMSKR